jgi:hypothetical protein
MRLYYHPLSSNARRVLMTARHLGIDLELVQVDLSQGAQNRPEFLKLNPNHRVPVLEHDGFVLWESYAIMQYLADLTPGQTLYPTELKARADVNRWLFWCGQDFMPGAAILNWENAIKPRFGIGPTDADEVARGERLMKPPPRFWTRTWPMPNGSARMAPRWPTLPSARPWAIRNRANIRSARSPVCSDGMPGCARWRPGTDRRRSAERAPIGGSAAHARPALANT